MRTDSEADIKIGPPDGTGLSDADITAASQPVRTLLEAVGRVVVGQDRMIRGLLLGLLAGGHVLLEGMPGLAKSLTVSTLARAMDASFQRIQFTPDLLPADLIGTLVYNPRDGVFTPRKGPLFANLVLADEVNRAPAKVQSALLEAMQERHVTIGDTTYDLPDPFLVLATQNPIEQEGTYALPEAQVDRFMLKVIVEYPTREQERRIVDRMAAIDPPRSLGHVIDLAALSRARSAAARVHVDPRIKDYIVDLVRATRAPEDYGLDLKGLVQHGASPRASIWLTIAARTWAFLDGRPFVMPSDVKSVAAEVVAHRVGVTYEAEAEGVTSADIVRRVLEKLPVP
jgi:MoxR-like ATPase